MYVKHDYMDRIYQGDIFKDLTIIDSWKYNEDRGYDITYVNIDYAVVMTQDCDLASDYRNREEIRISETQKRLDTKSIFPLDKFPVNDKEEPPKHDKYLPMVLICPAYPSELLKTGTHLSDQWKQNMENWGKQKNKFHDIKIQGNPRFHYLKGDQDLQIADLIIDFKHYFTIPRDELYRVYKDVYLISLNQLFREYLSQRFVYYFSRIGLPDLPKSTSDENTSPVNTQ